MIRPFTDIVKARTTTITEVWRVGTGDALTRVWRAEPAGGRAEPGGGRVQPGRVAPLSRGRVALSRGRVALSRGRGRVQPGAWARSARDVTDGLDIVAVGVADERAEVVLVVLRPDARRVQDLSAHRDGRIEEGLHRLP
jgi:hypothetical protein